MNVLLLAALVIAAGLAGAMLRWLGERQPRDSNALIDTIDATLPQTQCAQCGYPGCRPYAEAVANGESHTLCPPGGEATARALAALLGRSSDAEPVLEEPVLAKVSEEACIGCTLCLPACPVDAILGAKDMLHTVIDDECTGCGLCLPPCPVDCIELVAVRKGPTPNEVSAQILGPEIVAFGRDSESQAGEQDKNEAVST